MERRSSNNNQKTQEMNSVKSVIATIYSEFEPWKIRAPTHAILMTSSILRFRYTLLRH